MASLSTTTTSGKQETDIFGKVGAEKDQTLNLEEAKTLTLPSN